MSRIAEAAYGDRLPQCSGSCLSRGCNCVYRGNLPAPYHFPGFKEPTPSKEAAKAVAPGAGAIRERVFEAIAASEGGLTADEAAAIVGRKPGYVRPRVSELAAAGRIVGAGPRRRNPDTGLSAKIWRKA